MGGNPSVKRDLELLRLGYRFGKDNKLSFSQIEQLVREANSA